MKFKPNKNETMVQFELAYQLRDLKIPFHLEYKVRNDKNVTFEQRGKKRIARGNSRIDVAVYRNDEVICLIECKRSARPSWSYGRQYAKYLDFGVPLFLCDGFDKIPAAIAFVLTVYNQNIK